MHFRDKCFTYNSKSESKLEIGSDACKVYVFTSVNLNVAKLKPGNSYSRVSHKGHVAYGVKVQLLPSPCGSMGQTGLMENKNKEGIY